MTASFGVMAPATDVLRTAIGDIEIVYDVIGQPTNPPVLLISGMGAQLIDWHEDFCQELVDRGLFVIRFDNRDVGLSSHLDGAVPPDLATTTDCDQWKSPYALTDMAADAAGLIHNLGLGSAHVVGISLGGMIAQTLAIRHPAQVRSLTSIMSTTGNDQVGRPTAAAMALLVPPSVTTREETIEGAVAFSRAVGSPAYPIDEAEVRARAARAFDRSFDPMGVARQMAAAFGASDRSEGLGRLTVPALVIHGAADPIFK
jgi:pimeloyl-ACP methyl ester carboxylesterase